MAQRGYIGNFGANKGGLSTVERAWINASRAVIGSWAGVSELQAGSGIYYLFEQAAAGAKWIAWRSGETEQAYILASIAGDTAVFNFGKEHTGKSVAYQYLDENNVAVGAEITADIEEYEDSGVYVAWNISVPVAAVFIKMRTIEATPVYIAISEDELLGFQIPKDGPYMEEV